LKIPANKSQGVGGGFEMITGKKVRLRALERSDLPYFVTWFNDPEVTQGLLIHWQLSIGQEEKWYERVLARPFEEQPLMIEVQTPEGWQAIGDLGFNEIDRLHRNAEIGIAIGDKRFWNQGFGTEAMSLMVRYGFNDLNLHRIYLQVYETNPRAIRSYEKAGFVREGVMREAVFKDGRYINVVLMSVLRPEWKFLEH
jgi:diamine N-acetyltransferase